MEKTVLNFSECTLALLDKKFNLSQILKCEILENWLNQDAEISSFEKQLLHRIQHKLILNVHDWNETELIQNFIGPVFAFVDYTTKRCNFFAGRYFSGIVHEIELHGKPDGMIASGFREPEQPYFCFQEYKKSMEQKGDPAGQCLAAMLVAQEMNEHQTAIYGCHVIGADWYFMLLQGKEYIITPAYVATRDDIFDIFRILKALKQIIIGMLE
ncbi:MAG: hypothetical protein B6242_06370 [Anaerolineaceae bacterium 4572_78]|nr:MAG: hypothetical protein B6242_06370 [Anaerolineaceae bacterium 4572_78]